MNEFEKSILNKIKSGEISMKPRWHFVLRAALLLGAVIFIAASAVFLSSFVMFVLNNSGVWFSTDFGFEGIVLFISSFPLLLVSVAAVFLGLLYVLVKRYSFSYRHPLVYSMVGAVALVFTGSFLVSQTTVHADAKTFAERHNVPGFSQLYKSAENHKPAGVLRGTIESINEDGFYLEMDTGDRLKVIVTDRTKQKPGSALAAGNEVMVFGKKNKEEPVMAFGIRPVPDFKSKQSEFLERKAQMQNRNQQNIRPSERIQKY